MQEWPSFQDHLSSSRAALTIQMHPLESGFIILQGSRFLCVFSRASNGDRWKLQNGVANCKKSAFARLLAPAGFVAAAAY